MAIVPDEDLTWVRLGPLGAEDIAAVAAGVAGGLPGPRLRAALAGTGGNPSICVQLVAALARERRIAVDGARRRAGRRRRRARRSRPPPGSATAGLPARAAEAVRAAAVIGPCAPSELSAVLDRSPGELAADLATASDEGLLDPRRPDVAFRHPVVQEAIATDVPGAVRSALHHAVGRHLAACGGPAFRVAHHLALGAPASDLETATWLRRAAHDVRDQDPSWALSLVERAIGALPASDPRRPDVLGDRAELLITLGRFADAEAAVAGALAGRPAMAVRTRLHVLLGEDARPGRLARVGDRPHGGCGRRPRW